MLAGDFNIEDHEPRIKPFLHQYESKNLVKQPTCYKSIENPSCIDLFITNNPRSFQNTEVLNIGCSDFHQLSITVLKTKFQKLKPKQVTYRCYKNFDQVLFKNDLSDTFGQFNKTYAEFENVFLETMEKHGQLKKKIIRGNHVQYMNKVLRKAIMRRTQLQNKYYK